jgi:Zn-finger nucleic acid-binding protein
MRQLSLPSADTEVDLCDACGGMWIDWHDGDVRLVASETLRASDPGPPPSSKSGEPKPSRNEPPAAGACPRCAKQLVPERYTIKAEVPSTRVEGKISIIPATTGAELLRCEECMGAYVSRENAEILAALSRTDEAPPSQGKASLRPLPWDRFVSAIRGFLRSK